MSPMKRYAKQQVLLVVVDKWTSPVTSLDVPRHPGRVSDRP